MTKQVTEATEARTRLDARTRRDLILKSATQIFARYSYRMAAVADIAREAGTSEPTVYKHFASKKELFLTILEKVGSSLLKSWQEAASREPDPIQLLRQIGLAHYEATHAHPESLRIQFQALSEVEDEDVKQVLRESFEAYLGFLGQIVDRAKEVGAIDRAVDSQAMAWQFLSIGFTFNLSSLLGFQSVVTRDTVDLMGSQLLQSLSPSPAAAASHQGDPVVATSPPKKNGKVKP